MESLGGGRTVPLGKLFCNVGKTPEAVEPMQTAAADELVEEVDVDEEEEDEDDDEFNINFILSLLLELALALLLVLVLVLELELLEELMELLEKSVGNISFNLKIHELILSRRRRSTSLWVARRLSSRFL